MELVLGLNKLRRAADLSYVSRLPRRVEGNQVKTMFSFDFDGERMLDDYLRTDRDAIRSEMEEIARRRVEDAIGPENLSKVTLRFSGTDLADLKMHVEGPYKLKAKIKAALGGGSL